MERVMQDKNNSSRRTTLSADIEVLQAENLCLKQELQFKEQFIATMNHELRTPLNAILGLSEALIEEAHGPMNPRQKKLLNGIDESGRLLFSLIRDVVDVLGASSGEASSIMSEIVPQEFLANCIRLVEPQTQNRNIRLSLRVSKSSNNIVINQRLFKQLILIALTFVIKNVPQGSALLIDLSPSLQNKMIDLEIITRLPYTNTTGKGESDAVDCYPFSLLVQPMVAELNGTIEFKKGEAGCPDLTFSVPWLTVTSAEYVSQYVAHHTPLWG